jgi:hypothetical protein
MTPELLTVRQAGELLGLGETKAHELANRGILPTFETGFHRGRVVRRADVLALVDQLATTTATNATATATRPETPRSSTKRRRTK